jgi:hypothetical protein
MPIFNQMAGSPMPPPGGAPDPAMQQDQMRQAMAQKAKMNAVMQQRYGANPPQFGGGRPPPPMGPEGPPPGQFAGAKPPPPPGMGMQAAGFAPRQAPPAGQFAGRFPGAQAPRPPQFAGGAFGMRPVSGGGGGSQFGGFTKAPQMAGQMGQMGGAKLGGFGR